MRTLSILFTLLFVFLLQNLDAEKYNVLHVRGTIVLKDSEEPLSKGDVIDSEDQVSFRSKDALAALFSPSKGRFTLTPKQQGEAFGEEFFAYVKSSVVPARKGLSSRSGMKVMNRVDLVNHFSRDRYLILGETTIRIAVTAYPMSDSTFFFLRYDVEGMVESVNKKLNHSGEILEFSPDKFLFVDGKPVDPGAASNFKLFYYDAVKTESRLICDVHPVIPDMEALREEVRQLVELIGPSGSDDSMGEGWLEREVSDYLQEYYGQPDAENLSEWLEQNVER